MTNGGCRDVQPVIPDSAYFTPGVGGRMFPVGKPRKLSNSLGVYLSHAEATKKTGVRPFTGQPSDSTLSKVIARMTACVHEFLKIYVW